MTPSGELLMTCDCGYEEAVPQSSAWIWDLSNLNVRATRHETEDFPHD